jgi:hypothetical protein
MTIQFWSNDPTILLNKEYIFSLWPTASMTYEEKLNAISRLILLLTILGYILTMSTRILVVGALTLLGIFVFYNMRKKKLSKETFEGLTSNTADKEKEKDTDKKADVQTNKEQPMVNSVPLDKMLKTEFKEGNKKNPFSNVLLTQINDEPDRKAAPPAFNVVVDEDITKNVKKTIQMLNPGIKNTNKQLFGDLWQQFELDNCMRVFSSTPNTRIANDQGAYAQYLYNDLKYSGKESTPEGAIARVKDNWRWIDG